MILSCQGDKDYLYTLGNLLILKLGGLELKLFYIATIKNSFLHSIHCKIKNMGF